MAEPILLFVDDDPNILQGIKRMLRPQQKIWKILTASGGQEALEILAQHHVDVIISDMRMPIMNGETLLRKVRDSYPHTSRIMLTGQADQESVLRSIDLTHQFIGKPVKSDELRAILSRTINIIGRLKSKQLLDLVGHSNKLPSPSSIYCEIVEVLQDDDAPIQRIANIISKDLSMTTKILKVVNSAFVGVREPVGSIRMAISMLGLNLIKALVLTHGIFSALDESTSKIINIEEMWSHSQRVAYNARSIAHYENLSDEEQDVAYTVGLLHDVGKIILIVTQLEIYKSIYRRSTKEKIQTEELEHAELGITHAHSGGYILRLWGLPDFIVETVLYHHDPDNYPFKPVPLIIDLVYWSNQFEDEDGDSTQTMDRLSEGRIVKWRQVCSETKI